MSVSPSKKTTVICDCCDQFRNTDRILAGETIHHHEIWTALCRSAKNGCAMCQGIIRSQEMTRPHNEPLHQDFDAKIDAEDTQITWRRWGGDENPFILRQEKIFKDDPMANIIKGRPISEHSDSDACKSLLLRWLEECKIKHSQCVWKIDQPLPERVIDIGSSSELTPVDPFLLITNGKTGTWVTLSHSWGGKLPLATTKATLEQRKITIPMAELPPTFRDAVTITRRLGFRYLWIDSLCIVQDSRKDWEIQSTKMHEIYSDAAINISASAAHNAKEGIFSSADLHRHYANPFASLHCYSQEHNLEGMLYFRTDMELTPFVSVVEQPLHQRAWVLQETVLSPRRIDFMSSQILWSCRTLAEAEASLQEVPYSSPIVAGGRDLFRIPKGTVPSHPDLDNTNSTVRPLSFWYRALWSYCSRGITVHEDFLPAIAGVAQAVAERTGYHYKCGLWLEDLHRGLLWQATSSINRAKRTSSPSWSWASAQPPWGGPNMEPQNYKPGFRASVLEINVSNVDGNPFAQVVSASLKLKGQSRPLAYWKDEETPTYNSTSNMELRDRSIVPDLLGDARKDLDKCHHEMMRRNVICLQIAKFGHYESEHYAPDTTTIYALILEPTGGTIDEYKRIGIAEIPEEDGMAEDWDTKIITIV
ncbi:uncharacterized protein PAC_15311 [Phialocephala subalpina]|uniref:Heterokaryon incompatibility domain-containing protein n=1 Tax=Phialocephala subalpina TaxID=576137 RepID=A0A1L7XK31_9HELO|nr:uncharacterized protein PAC_15311 [Phialocephala subalpina]